MLSHNIRMLRKEKGLSQQELACRLNVVRQTVSKWEQGLSVPDADLLIRLSQELETPVNVLFGENRQEKDTDELKVIANKLEVINLQIAESKKRKEEIMLAVMVIVMIGLFAGWVWLYMDQSSYMSWDYSDPETAVLATGMHIMEWLFVRFSPFFLIICAVNIFVVLKSRYR